MKKAFPESKAEIVERVRGLVPNAARKWGKMTAQQMACHLTDSYLLAMGERTASSKSNFFSKTVMKFGALHVPMQWPKGVPTMPELDQAAGAGTPPAVFETDKGELLRIIDRFTAMPREFRFAPHPMFAEMSEWEWMRWGYLHADHHLRQFGL